MKKILGILLVLVLVVSMSLTVLVGCTPKDDNSGIDPIVSDKTGIYDEKEYSYRMGPSKIPSNWNILNYQENTATYVLNYSTDSLYTFDYNDAGDAFQIVPGMASDYPTDVSSEYVGKYGVKEGEVGKVYSIPLKTYLKFDNGDPITAYTFEESMKLLLDPAAANFRADNVYQSGNLKIVGAESYVKGGTYAYGEFVSADCGAEEYIDPAKFTLDEDGYYQVEVDGVKCDLVVNIDDGGNWGEALSLYAAYNYLMTGLDVDPDTNRTKVFTQDGEWVMTRSLDKVVLNPEAAEEDQVADFEFYDLEGNKLAPRTQDEEGTYHYTDKDGNAVPAWDNATAHPVNAYYDPLEAAADEAGYVKLNEELLLCLQTCVAQLHGCDDLEAYIAKCEGTEEDYGVNYALVEFEEMAMLGREYEEVDYNGNVGFFAKDDYTLVVVLVNPMEYNFYLKYELCTDFFLVHPGKYKECLTESQGVITPTYGTSVDTYVGFGPYKLTKFVDDNSIVLSRNMTWRGYDEREYQEGTYQVDNIVYQKVSDDAIRLEMFLKGELDSYGLTAEDMEDYVLSPYVYYDDSESTWYMAMNPDVATLTSIQSNATPQNAGNAVVKTVLAIEEFRQAMSWSLDRQQFNLTLSPTSGVAKALLSAKIYADPEAGIAYRATDEGKDAILEFWGLSDKWGEGKEYTDRDAAIASITGYDPAGAKVLFDTAYDKAVEAGYITEEMIASGKWEVQLCIGIPSSANFYKKGAEFLSKNWAKAVEGTKFEGHFTFVNSAELGQNFSDYLHNGSVDLLFGVGYSGSQFDPYRMMDCFTGSLQYDTFTDKEKEYLDITIDLGDGVKTYSTSLYSWVSEILLGTEVEVSVIENGEVVGKATIAAGTSVDGSIRTKILAACETKIMTLSNIFPMMTDASASLRCMRIKYKTEEYIEGLGRGGIKYNTVLMSDEEFAAYVASQGGTLNYK